MNAIKNDIYTWIAQAANPTERIHCPAFAPAAQQDEVLTQDRLKQFQAMLAANADNKDNILASLAITTEQLEQAVLAVEVIKADALPDWAQQFYQLMNTWQGIVANGQSLKTVAGYDKGMDENKFAFSFSLLAKIQLKPIIAKLNAADIEIESKAINGLLAYFIGRLYIPVINTLSACYFDNSTSVFQSDIDYNALETWQSYFNQQPVAARIVGTINADWLDSSDEMLRRFANDIALIKANFLEDSEQNIRILDIKPGLGDPHRGGRSVAIISTNLGAVVYKPKNLFGTEAIGRLLQTLHPIEPDYVPLTPTFINQGDYGWEQKVSAKSATSKAQVIIYYQRLGAWLRLLQVLNANDFWYDNLIAAGDMPYFIDYETIIGLPFFEDNTPVNTLMGIGMLPKITPGTNHDLIDISCVVTPGIQKTPIKIQHKFGTEKTQSLDLKATDFAVYLNGEFQDINHYFDAFERGFLTINQLLLSASGKEALETFIDTISPARFRHIYIDTWSAYDLISTVHSACCRDGVRQEIIYHNYLFSALRYYDFKVIESAISSIKHNDIPIYEIDALTRNAYTHDNQCIAQASKRTPIDYIQENITRLSEVQADLSIVRTLYSMRLDNLKPRYHNQPTLAITNYQPLQIAKQIGQYLLSLFDQNKADFNLSQVSISNYLHYKSLSKLVNNFDGAPGILLFFQRLYELTKEQEYYQPLKSLYQFMQQDNDYEKIDKGYGLFNYRLAKIILYEQLTPYFDSSALIQANYDELMQILDDSDELIEGHAFGISGLLTTLANTKSIDTSDYEQAIEKYLKQKRLKKQLDNFWLDQHTADFFPNDALAAKLAQSYYSNTLPSLTTDSSVNINTQADINTCIYLKLLDKERIADKISLLMPKDLTRASTQHVVNSLYNHLYFEKYYQQTSPKIKTLSLHLINRFVANKQWFCDTWAEDKHQLSAHGGLADIGLAFLAQVDSTAALNIARLNA